MSARVEDPSHIRAIIALALIALATLAVYWPGLYGGYIHDDYSFIVDNTDVHVTSMDLGDWLRAAESFPAAKSGRWLTMISFAANYYFTGLDPFWFKLTNVAIHLINGLLLYFGLFTLLRIFATRHQPASDAVIPLYSAALAITACWLLLPINLAAVLYTAQRLESLSTTFILLGLWLYLRGRLRLEMKGHGMAAMAASLVVCTGIGLLFKESAALLPMYTLSVELVLGSFAQRGLRKPLLWLYGLLLAMPLAAGSFWLLTWVDFRAAARTFDVIQRVMTEWRIIVDYIGWSLLPLPHSLSLYHDDIQISRGLLQPLTTLLSLGILLGLLTIALWQRKQRPLLCLGILWFFGGHVMTGTILPLELVYEHRNYFASCGLLLALASILALEPIILLRARALSMIAAAFMLFYGVETALRAKEWSHPVRLALAEVSKDPASPRAQYDLGRALVIASGYKADSPLLPRARKAFEDCRTLPHASILCEQGLIVMSANLKQTVEDAWWTSLQQRLIRRPATESDINALTALLDCQVHQVCPQQSEKLGVALQQALGHPEPTPRLLLVYSDFASYYLHDYALSERMLREVVKLAPRLPAARAKLIQLLTSEGKLDEAEGELVMLKHLDHFGSIDYMIQALQAQVNAMRAEKGAFRPLGSTFVR